MPSSSGSARLLAWSVSAALILVVGLGLYLSRSALLPGLEKLPDLASPTKAEEPPPVETETISAPAEPEVEEPRGPQLTYEEIETMIASLPTDVLSLIDGGEGELPDYKDMSSKNESKASRSQRFFQNWGTSWRNRVAELRKRTPPWEECEIHAALAPTCAMLEEVYGVLETVPSVTAVDDGQTVLDEARQLVDDFLNPPEEEIEGDEVAELTGVWRPLRARHPDRPSRHSSPRS